MSNRVTFGLDQVHVAFKGVAQVESIEVTAACGTDGELTVTVTGAPLTGGSEAVVVPLSTESHSTVTKVASAVCDALNNNVDVSEHYTAYHTDGVIYLKARVVATNDATLSIAFTPGSTGVTVGSSTNVTAGTTGWGTPTAIPGAVKFTPKAEGSETKFYADNTVYYLYNVNTGYTADLEMALVPDSVLATMLGWEIDDNGALVEISDGEPTSFALLGQVQGDNKNRRFCYYYCQANRPDKEHSTVKDTREPQTDVLKLTITPLLIGSRNIVKSVLELSDSNASVYNAWFTQVTEPTFS